MHRGMLHHVVSQIAGSILATAILYGMAHEIEVLLQIDIERRHSPMALRHLRFFFHPQHSVLGIKLHHTCTLQFLDRRLFMTHDTTRLFLLRKVHELLEREEQQVIRSHHQHIIVYLQFLHCKQQVANSPQSGLVRLCPVIHDCDFFTLGPGPGIKFLISGPGPRVKFCPVFEDRGELMIGNNDMLIDIRDGIDIIKHSPENRILAYLQQRFGEILREFP